jgi:hypothetical protein
VKFKADVSFAEFPWLPPYWKSLLGIFSKRGGLSSAVLGESGEDMQATEAQSKDLEGNEAQIVRSKPDKRNPSEYDYSNPKEKKPKFTDEIGGMIKAGLV